MEQHLCIKSKFWITRLPWTLELSVDILCVSGEWEVTLSGVTLARRKEIVLRKTDCTRNLLIYVDCFKATAMHREDCVANSKTLHEPFVSCANCLFLFSDQRLCIVNSVSVCVCVCVHIYIYIHIHTSHCVEILYELQLLPSSTASETFLHKSGAVRSVKWVFITEAPTWRGLCDYTTSDKTF